ncbi:MAG TPA: SURF1 family protein [Actinomycetes bacterium]|nr:SURF1 family protein [Actinomycetes bacterium]
MPSRQWSRSTSLTARTALAPRWWGWHLLLVVAVGTMGWLGWWQLQSFEGADRPDAAETTRAVPLDRVTAPGDRLRPGDPGRLVTVAGTWEAGSQVVVPGRERAGRVGALVVTPLRTARGVVPVVRGWVPDGAAAPAPPAERVAVRGVLQRSETEADATTVVPQEGEVGYVATVALLAASAYDPDQLYDGFVVLRSTRPALAADPAAPALVAADRHEGSGQVGQVGAWRNLAYAVQWWLFAAAAVFFWAIVLRRAAQEAQEPPEQPAGPAPTGQDAPGAALSAPPRRT